MPATTKMQLNDKDFPLVDHGVELLEKQTKKAKSALAALSLATGTIESLATQAAEVKRQAKKAQGDGSNTPQETWSLNEALSAALRVGVHLHLDQLAKIKRAQEKAGVVTAADTARLIRTAQDLADRLSPQLVLAGPSGVNQITFDISPWTPPDDDEEDGE